LRLCGAKGAKGKTRHGGKAKLSAAWIVTVGHTEVSEFMN
jgi:hypothetical protein